MKEPDNEAEALYRLTEWNLATLEGALLVKRTPKCEVRRFSAIAYRSLIFCRRFLQGPVPRSCVRTRRWLDNFPSCVPEDFHKLQNS